MEAFRTAIQIEHHLSRGRLATVADVLVDTSSMMTWIPEEILRSLGITVEDTKRFVTTTGGLLHREVGYAIVHAAGAMTVDEVVFAKPGERIVLGAHSLSGLNLKVDSSAKQLIPAGPILAGAASAIG